MRRPKPNNLFFGLLTKDDWVWIDNTPFNKSLWKLGYPTGGHGIQSCAVMSAGSSNKIIKSVNCRSAKYFLCQKRYGRWLKYFKSVVVYFVSYEWHNGNLETLCKKFFAFTLKSCQQKMKIRREVLTLKSNWSSLKICVALWDNYAYFLPTYWSAVTFKRSYSNAN